MPRKSYPVDFPKVEKQVYLKLDQVKSLNKFGIQRFCLSIGISHDQWHYMRAEGRATMEVLKPLFKAWISFGDDLDDTIQLHIKKEIIEKKLDWKKDLKSNIKK